MAKIELTRPAYDNRPASTETIEVRAWDLGGTEKQAFYLAHGCNFQASTNVWVEIIYSIQGAQILYTRSFLHLAGFDAAQRLEQLDELVQNGEGEFGIGYMLPETSLDFKAQKSTYEDDSEEGKVEIKSFTCCTLELSADTGSVFGYASPPGSRWIKIKFRFVEFEDGVRFMRELVHEIDDVYSGKHPDPACLPPDSSEWPLVWQLNQKAYDDLAGHFKENYFINPLLKEAFDGWLAQLPEGGKVLDAGCGSGDPVIGRLLEKSFRVTGADFSPEMLRRARETYPQAAFVRQAATQLDFEAFFDGACSFNSLLYLDPIDFYNTLYQLYRAIKPGGLLFLYSYDPGPDWRGEPYHVFSGHWIWGWHYGMQEAAGRLEEHGRFKVIAMQRVAYDADEEQRVAQEVEAEKLEEAEYYRQKKDSQEPFVMPFIPTPHERPPYAYVIIAQRAE